MSVSRSDVSTLIPLPPGDRLTQRTEGALTTPVRTPSVIRAFSIQLPRLLNTRTCSPGSIPRSEASPGCIHNTEVCSSTKPRCPNVEFILDHIAKPDIAGGEIEQWRENITRLAQFENVACKLSGLVTEADHAHWKPTDLQPYVEHVLDVFGTDRLMFGSDFPVCTWASTFSRWFETLEQFLAPLSDAEKQAIYHDNAVRFYGLAD